MDEIYIPRIRQVMSRTNRGIPEASNMLRLRPPVSVLCVKNVRWCRLLLGETRRTLSAGHVSLSQHKIKTHRCHCPGKWKLQKRKKKKTTGGFFKKEKKKGDTEATLRRKNTRLKAKITNLTPPAHT